MRGKLAQGRSDGFDGSRVCDVGFQRLQKIRSRAGVNPTLGTVAIQAVNGV